MKTSVYIAILSLLGFGSCASQKKLHVKPPFVVEAPSFQKWTGGKEQSGSGVDVQIPIREFKKENITFKEIYFRGQIGKATTATIDGIAYVKAKFTDHKFIKPDLIMHADPRKEVGNQPPMPQSTKNIAFPFELTDTEAIISYTENNHEKVKYTKISGLKEKQPLIYSSKEQN